MGSITMAVGEVMAGKIDRAKLFGGVRSSVFGGRLKQGQVDGINHIVDAWEKSAFTDLRWLAYMLGTAYHETAATMQPIHEYGSTAYFTQMYDVRGRRPSVARQMGNTNPGDGARYCGRGYVQLTWKNNYKRAGEIVGVDLVADPDEAMDPDIAAEIMFAGMTDTRVVFENVRDDKEFSFTGKTLEDYFADDREDWIGARRIINGTDHAELIAETAQDFNDALEYETSPAEATA